VTAWPAPQPHSSAFVLACTKQQPPLTDTPTYACMCTQTEAKSKQEKEKEDAYWRAAGEGAKSKGAAKREEEEKKRLEQLAKKAELKRLQEQEEAALLKPKANPKANRVTGQKVRHPPRVCWCVAVAVHGCCGSCTVAEKTAHNLLGRSTSNKQQQPASQAASRPHTSAPQNLALPCAPSHPNLIHTYTPIARTHPNRSLTTSWIRCERLSSRSVPQRPRSGSWQPSGRSAQTSTAGWWTWKTQTGRRTQVRTVFFLGGGAGF
jgi:hypothetical protein